MRLIFLGTGAGVPSRLRNVSSLALDMSQSGGPTWLFDAGEGTQLQILKTSISLRRVEKVFISHLHGDHVFGLPGLLSTRSFQAETRPLHLYGPPGITDLVESTLRLTSSHLTYPLEITEVNDGDVLFHDKGLRVIAGLLDHSLPCFGYRIEEDPFPGALQIDRLKAEGVEPGPAYSALKAGQEVTLPDRRVINGKDYLDPDYPGRVLAILSDTRATSRAVDLARNADVLVHESTYAESERHMTLRFAHATCIQAAQIAAQAEVTTLLLTHISQRYGQAQDLEAEARTVFPSTHVMSDLQVVTLPTPGRDKDRHIKVATPAEPR